MNDAFVEDSKVVLSLCADAFRNGRIEVHDAGRISECADDFLELEAWILTRFKETGVKLAPPEDIPNLHQLKELLRFEKYSAALDEAEKILTVMNRVLKLCEKRHRDYVRRGGTKKG